MILAIDIGNTNIVLGCMEHDRILVEVRMATDLLKTSDQYCVELKNLLNLYEIDPKSVEGVIISSVVPPVLNSCKTAVRKLTGKTPMIVGPGIKTGLNIQMENPAQIGSDLIVAAVAALYMNLDSIYKHFPILLSFLGALPQTFFAAELEHFSLKSTISF